MLDAVGVQVQGSNYWDAVAGACSVLEVGKLETKLKGSWLQKRAAEHFEGAPGLVRSDIEKEGHTRCSKAKIAGQAQAVVVGQMKDPAVSHRPMAAGRKLLTDHSFAVEGNR